MIWYGITHNITTCTNELQDSNQTVKSTHLCINMYLVEREQLIIYLMLCNFHFTGTVYCSKSSFNYANIWM